MKKYSILFFSVFVVLALSGVAGAVIIEIPAMTNPHIWIDFDTVGPAGPTSVAAINAATGANLADIVATPNSLPGLYNTQTQRGRALALDPQNPNTLFLVDPNGPYYEMDYLDVFLGGHATQFGWSLGDWMGPFNAQFYSGMAMVGEIVGVDFNGSPDPHFIESSVAFDSVRLTALPQYSAANWVIPDLYVEQVPEPTSMLLFGVGLLVMTGLRRKYNA